jgi:TP901-1 family phage major tail protein
VSPQFDASACKIDGGNEMGAQKGKDLLLKVDAAQTGTFETVAGMRSRRIAFNAESVDITNADSAGRWRELLEGAGVRRAGVSGAGIFKDAASDASVRTLFFDGSIRPWQIIVPDFGTISGPFQVSGLEYSGEHDGEVSYEIALESAGVIAFTAI